MELFIFAHRFFRNKVSEDFQTHGDRLIFRVPFCFLIHSHAGQGKGGEGVLTFSDKGRVGKGF